MNQKQRGVYFVGNDRVMELCIAFLNSFRAHNAEIPLCLIPYNEQSEELKKLKGRYGFSIFDDDRVLTECDQISLHFHKKKYGHYRKLAVWEGVFDEFIYIDIDTVVLANFDFAFDLLSEYDFLTAVSNIPSAVRWTWKKSVYESGQLNPGQIEFAANTGFIASRKSALPLSEVRKKLPDAVKLRPHMNLYCFEQPLLNYLMVTSGGTYAGINVLTRTPKYAHLKTERWAGDRGGKVKNGRIFFRHQKDEVLFLHWAGKWQIYPREMRWIKILKSLRIISKDEEPVLSYFMPYKKLWKYYRYLHEHTDNPLNLSNHDHR